MKNSSTNNILNLSFFKKIYHPSTTYNNKTFPGTLTVLICFLLCIETATAQTHDSITESIPMKITVEPVIVSSGANYHNRMSLTSLYDGDNRTSMQTMESALKLNPSFDIRERGSKGVQADISVRGGSFDQTMILLNGINFTDARTGHQTHSLPVDMDIVSSISLVDDMVKSGAYAGAINIKTNPFRDNYLRGEVSGGEYGYRYSILSGAVTKGKIQILGAISYRQSDGYIENTDFERLNTYINASYDDYRTGRFELQAGLQNNSFGSNGFYSLAYPNQYEQTKTGLASLKWNRTTEWMDISADVYYRKNFDRFELIKGDEQLVPFNYHETDNYGADIQIGTKGLRSNTTFGASYTHNGILSTVLGETIDNPSQKVWGGNSDRLYTKAKARDVLDSWVSQDFHAGNFSAVGWVGANSSPYGTSFIWGVTLQQALLKMHTVLYGGAVHSMRLPTYTDLYYTATGYTGNTELKPEKAITYRVGGDYLHNGIMASAVFYYRAGNDIIDWVKNSAEDNWQSMQITSLGTFGSEIMLGYSSNTIINTAKLTYAYISTDKKTAGYKISKYALDYLKNKVSGNVVFALFNKKLTLGLTGTLFDRNGNYADKNGEIKNYDPYFLLDGRLTWSDELIDNMETTLYLDITNITSTEYFDFGGLVMPKKWVNIGFRLTI